MQNTSNNDVSRRYQMFVLSWSSWEEKCQEFISLLLWPPNLPDLNLVDYSMWSIPQENTYKTPITDLDDLEFHIRIRTKWATLYRAVIAAAVSVALPSFSLCQGGQWSFPALLLILILCFCNNCDL